jgi:hypothetical protein
MAVETIAVVGFIFALTSIGAIVYEHQMYVLHGRAFPGPNWAALNIKDGEVHL